MPGPRRFWERGVGARSTGAAWQECPTPPVGPAARQDERRGEGRDESGCDLGWWFDALLDQDGELVAAEPGDGVPGAQAAAQPVGELDEQGVAGGVPEAVVDGLTSSTSQNRTNVDDVARDRSARACSTRAWNRVRFARPASGSCSAWWRACSRWSWSSISTCGGRPK